MICIIPKDDDEAIQLELCLACYHLGISLEEGRGQMLVLLAQVDGAGPGLDIYESLRQARPILERL